MLKGLALLLLCLGSRAALLGQLFRGRGCSSEPALQLLARDSLLSAAERQQCRANSGCQDVLSGSPLSAFLPLGWVNLQCDAPRTSLDSLPSTWGELQLFADDSACGSSSWAATIAIKLDLCIKASLLPLPVDQLPGGGLFKAIKVAGCSGDDLSFEVYADEACSAKVLSYPAALACYELPVPIPTDTGVSGLPSKLYVSTKCPHAPPNSPTYAPPPTAQPCCCHNPPSAPECEPSSELLCGVLGGSCTQKETTTGTGTSASTTSTTSTTSTRSFGTSSPTTRWTPAPTQGPDASTTGPAGTGAPPNNAVLVIIIIALVGLIVAGLVGFLVWRRKQMAAQKAVVSAVDFYDTGPLDSDADELDF